MASIPKRKLLLAQWASVSSCMKCRPQFGNSLSEIRLPSRYSSSSRTSLVPAAASVSVVQRDLNLGFQHQRFYSSKTPANASIVSAVATATVPETVNNTPAVVEDPTTTSPAVPAETEPAQPYVPTFSGFDIREVDQDTRIKVHQASAEVATAQAGSLINSLNVRRRKEILKMDESEYEHTFVLKNRPPLWDRRAEGENFFSRNQGVEKQNNIDWMCFIQADIDMRPKSLRKMIGRWRRNLEIEEQVMNPKRHAILGSDLAVAHFIVFRKGKVKFLGQKDWITSYRKDAKPGVPEEDLPVMRFDLCTLPTKYDPRYRVEGIDAQGVSLHFEGLSNFENLHYLKWLSLKESPHIDDWCLDRIARMYNETLEYIDLSGCKNVTDRGIGTLHRCRNLKAIRVENMPHLENLEIVSALLEDHLPNLQVIGVDYSGKAEQLRIEEQELEKQAFLKASNEEQKLLNDSTTTPDAPTIQPNVREPIAS